MNNANGQSHPQQGLNITPGDIIYTIFRHLKKIIFFAIIGVATGITIYRVWPTYYQSNAAIVIKFVTEDRVLDGKASTSVITPGGRNSSYMITNEIALLTSLDLAKIVAEKVGPTLIVDNPENPNPTILEAAGIILGGLEVIPDNGGNMLSISTRHTNPQIAKEIIEEIIVSYPKRHLELHRKSAAFEEYITRETDQMRMRLQQTEDEIRNMLRKANIISVDNAKSVISNQLGQTHQEIFQIKNQLAELKASILRQEDAIDTSLETNPSSKDAGVEVEGPSIAVLRQLSDLVERIEILREREKALSLKYTSENSLFQNVRQQVFSAEQQLEDLERLHPELANQQNLENNGDIEGNRTAIEQLNIDKYAVIKLETRYQIFETQLAELRTEGAKIDVVESNVNELERRKALQDSKYSGLLESMEKSRVQDDLGDGRVNNISTIQSPSPPIITADPNREKLAAGVGIGLAVLGLAWAFIFDLFIDRSIKRPTEIQRNLGIPLFMNLPDMNDKRFRKANAKASRLQRVQAGKLRQQEAAKKLPAYNPKSPTLQAAALARPEQYGKGAADVHSIAPWDDAHTLNEHFEALRDKVITYFESKNLTHKPKLIAMTGLGEKSGVTTIASGLAGSLSKIGEGNVLLVDMTLGQETAQQFYQGKSILNLDDVLDSSNDAKVENNLYVVAEGTSGMKLPRIMPQRFNKIMPKLRASDFDYIVFDMPPVSSISSTPRLASFMDVVLMVMESEETNRDVANQAIELLSDSKAHLGGILNKTKSRVPKRLEQDLLSQS